MSEPSGNNDDDDNNSPGPDDHGGAGEEISITVDGERILLGTAADSGDLKDERLSLQRVFTDWPAVVGPDVAAHCTVENFEDGVLFLRADSTAWSKELQLLAPGLVRRLNAELGQNTVLRVEIRGPQAPSWKRGPRAVRDGRGPRDTYG